MTEVKERHLFETYSTLFEPEEIRNDMTKSCMCWGFECGEGWYELIEDTLKKLQALNDPSIQVVQIKEKYGQLRMYTNGGSDEAYAIIDAAEALSEKTCESCGAPATVQRINGWYSASCDTCLKVRK